MELRIEKLTAGYGGKRVINNLDLTLPGGKITALLGPNGCGKSTLLKCLSRLLTPIAGEVWPPLRPSAGAATGAAAAAASRSGRRHRTRAGRLRPESVATAVGAAFRAGSTAGRQRARTNRHRCAGGTTADRPFRRPAAAGFSGAAAGAGYAAGAAR